MGEKSINEFKGGEEKKKTLGVVKSIFEEESEL